MSPSPSLGFVGAGRVARALAKAAVRAGWRVAAVASRTPDHAQRLAGTLPDCTAVAPEAIFSHADLVFLTVPDDAIAPAAAVLRPGPGQALVHCSGASEVALLAPAQMRGAAIGGFHPLYLFAGLDDDAERLAGCAITLEADGRLGDTLRALTAAIGCRALTIPAGQRMLYHAGANYAASFLLCMLDEAVQLWRHIGMDETEAREALWPLVNGTLDAARQKGLPGALAGPVSRGDAGVVAKHAAALAAAGGDHAALYAMLIERAIGLARQRPKADEAALQAISAAVAAHGAMSERPIAAANDSE
ncbi:NADP oxidoreductase [Pandoraea terrae]|uniref:NADP oxidoreductase n=1 Tax=Pandoraea terrae TaxID=1537710 RepID=A0A5E4XAQ4_9BURK|nr:DUF2520 domain-containing protein [Pandoraea terrae]VVE33414.1 NADP oxidoreductase [Pandoraea terrae]